MEVIFICFYLLRRLFFMKSITDLFIFFFGPLFWLVFPIFVYLICGSNIVWIIWFCVCLSWNFKPSKAWNFNPSKAWRQLFVIVFRRVEISSFRRVEIKRQNRWLKLLTLIIERLSTDIKAIWIKYMTLFLVIFIDLISKFYFFGKLQWL